MSNAARLAKQAYERKPEGQDRVRYCLSSGTISQIMAEIEDDAVASAFAASVSYTEALRGLRSGAASWGVVKLYYSAFYSIRSLMLLLRIVPFHAGRHYLFDAEENKFLKGGSSSHHWNWKSFRGIRRASGLWYFSEDSEESYGILRDNRDDANYRRAFLDPDLPDCISIAPQDFKKSIRTYRDDEIFFYTYLPDHRALSYPTKLIFEVDRKLKSNKIFLSDERQRYLSSIWPFDDRCPVSK